MPFKDPIKRKEYARQYTQKNKERHNENNTNWRRNNPEASSRYQKEYRKKNSLLRLEHMVKSLIQLVCLARVTIINFLLKLVEKNGILKKSIKKSLIYI